MGGHPLPRGIASADRAENTRWKYLLGELDYFQVTQGGIGSRLDDNGAAGQMIGALEISTLFVMEGEYDIDDVGVNVVNVLQDFEA